MSFFVYISMNLLSRQHFQKIKRFIQNSYRMDIYYTAKVPNEYRTDCKHLNMEKRSEYGNIT